MNYYVLVLVGFLCLAVGWVGGALVMRASKNRQLREIRKEQAEHMLHTICLPWRNTDDGVIAAISFGSLNKLAGQVGPITSFTINRYVSEHSDGEVLVTVNMTQKGAEK